MKILIFGGSGYIGSEFVRQLNKIPDIQVFTAPSRNVDGSCYTFFQLMEQINKFMPTVIINCAAYIGNISVKDCEDNKDKTILSNLVFPKMLGEICQSRNIILGHMSSGCLFNGYTSGGFVEDDNIGLSFASKCSFYTGTKVMAEDALQNVEKKYIWRIRLPFDNIDHPRNYLTKMMNFDRLLAAENSLSNRQESVIACIRCLVDEVPYGTYHVTNVGGIRPEEIVTMFRRILKINKDFQYFESTEALDKLTNIPRSNTVLNVDKLSSVGIHMTPVYESVEKSLLTWKSSSYGSK